VQCWHPRRRKLLVRDDPVGPGDRPQLARAVHIAVQVNPVKAHLAIAEQPAQVQHDATVTEADLKDLNAAVLLLEQAADVPIQAPHRTEVMVDVGHRPKPVLTRHETLRSLEPHRGANPAHVRQ
jgi:hypothetical protein